MSTEPADTKRRKKNQNSKKFVAYNQSSFKKPSRPSPNTPSYGSNASSSRASTQNDPNRDVKSPSDSTSNHRLQPVRVAKIVPSIEDASFQCQSGQASLDNKVSSRQYGPESPPAFFQTPKLESPPTKIKPHENFVIARQRSPSTARGSLEQLHKFISEQPHDKSFVQRVKKFVRDEKLELNGLIEMDEHEHVFGLLEKLLNMLGRGTLLAILEKSASSHITPQSKDGDRTCSRMSNQATGEIPFNTTGAEQQGLKRTPSAAQKGSNTAAALLRGSEEVPVVQTISTVLHEKVLRPCVPQLIFKTNSFSRLTTNKIMSLMLAYQ